MFLLCLFVTFNRGYLGSVSYVKHNLSQSLCKSYRGCIRVHVLDPFKSKFIDQLRHDHPGKTQKTAKRLVKYIKNDE